MFFKLIPAVCILSFASISVRAQETLRALPMPSEIHPSEGFLSIDGSYQISLGGYHVVLRSTTHHFTFGCRHRLARLCN